MEDRRCKLGLQGRRELVLLIEQGSTLRQAAACLIVDPCSINSTSSRRPCNPSLHLRSSMSGLLR